MHNHGGYGKLCTGSSSNAPSAGVLLGGENAIPWGINNKHTDDINGIGIIPERSIHIAAWRVIIAPQMEETVLDYALSQYLIG